MKQLSVLGLCALVWLSAAPPEASLSTPWIHGSESCSANADPAFEVRQYGDDTFVLRENKCINYEGPFIYLLFGRDKVFMQDTGAAPEKDNTRPFPVREAVQRVIDDWSAKHGGRQLQLLVTHSHAHGDHVGGDAQFAARANTIVVGTRVEDVQAFFGIRNWPADAATLDLGGRILDILPIPGHEPTSVAVYDRRTKLLLTGDTLYPGRLYIRDWPAYKASVRRLADFVRGHDVAAVLGTHVEMSSKPGVDYPIGSTYQPDEHVLPLTRAHILELDESLTKMGSAPVRETHADFIVYPR